MGEGASRRPAFRPEGPAADPRGGHPQARPPETAVRIKSFRSPRAMPFRSLRGRALAPSVERTAPARGAQGLLARFDGRRSPLPPAIGRPRLRHAQALRRRWRPAPGAVARAESAPSAAPLHCGPTAGPQQPWTIRVRFRRIEPYQGAQVTRRPRIRLRGKALDGRLMSVTEEPSIVTGIVEFHLPDGCVIPSGSLR